MTGAALLERLHRSGLQVAREGDRIRVWPAGRVDPELASLVRAHRAEVFEALPTAEQMRRIRGYAVELGTGGPEWGERLIRFLTREQAADVLEWLVRRQAQERPREAVR